MNPMQEFYICTRCFHASESPEHCHGASMIHYPGYPAGHPLLKPAIDNTGGIKSFMPRWMLEGVKTAVAAGIS